MILYVLRIQNFRSCELNLVFLALTRRKNAVRTLKIMSRRDDGLMGREKEGTKREKRETKCRKRSKDFHLAVERIRRPPVHP